MEKKHLLICGKLFDGIHDELKENMEILMEGKFIKEVGKNLSRPSDAEVIDLSHLTVTPGMIDAHIHSDIWDWREFWSTMHFHSDDWKTLSHLHTAQRTLERGFTSIRCHSASNWGYGVVDAKKMIKAGYFPGSRMSVACHLLGSPGSHADNGQSFAGNPMFGETCNAPNIGSGVDFFRDVVRKEVKYGGDFIKLFLSGGFSTPNDGPEDQQLSDEELETIISTAKMLHKPTTAHVYCPELMQKLIKFGITGMEHGAMIDEETVDIMEKTDTYLVPTMGCYDEIIYGDEENLKKKSPEFQEKLKIYAEKLRAGPKLIVKSKIRLGYGSDYVAVHQCYESWYEYQSMMKSGMDPFRILKAATSINAKILEMDHYIGTRTR
ncbi:MAG: amidohydrolase family protein [Dehalobacterium sp.]